MTKVLLALRRSLGDAVLFLATVQKVRRYFPDAEITLLVPRPYRELYLEQPEVKDIWTYQEQSLLALLLKIRRQKSNYYFDFHSSGRNILLNRLSGADHAAYDHHSTAEGNLYARYPNALEWHKFFLGRELGLPPGDSGQDLLQPQLALLLAEKAQASAKLTAAGLVPGRSVFLGTGASRRTKRWPPQHFAQLAELLWDRYQIGVVLAPGPEEAEQKFVAEVMDCMRARGLKLQGKNGVLLLGPQSLRELAAVLSQCKIYIGNDSGPKHLAVAVGIPTLTFFGPEDPEEWHPYPHDKHPLLFIPGLACRAENGGRWCGIAECVVERGRCMGDIDPFTALDKAKNFLGPLQ